MQPTGGRQGIRLRPTTSRDLGFVVQAEGHGDNRPFIDPWSRERHAAAIDDPDVAHLIIEDVSMGTVGFVIVAGLTDRQNAVELRRIVVTVKHEGIGRAAVRAVKELAFHRHHASRLWLDVKPGNDRARHLYETEGFVAAGAKGDGEHLIVMSILAAEHRAPTLHGSCLCGAVRYDVTGPLGPIGHCHCRTCRKAHAAAFATTAWVRRSDFRWSSGEDVVTSFESTPGKRRYFCARCGSHLIAAWQDAPTVIVRVGSLDCDPGGRPVAHVWTSAKAPWHEITDDLPQFPESAPDRA